MLSEAPGDIATLRGAEMVSVASVLGQVRVKMEDCSDEDVDELAQNKLAKEVVAIADSFPPDGLLAFNAPPVSSHLDHMSAASVGLPAAETLDLPVLGWTLSDAVAEQLSRECADSFACHRDEQIDLRVTVDRARQRLARRVIEGKAMPGSAPRRRLELLADPELALAPGLGHLR